MEIEYPNKKVVRNGVYISTKDSSAVPTIVFLGNPQKLYTLVMVDPDAVRGTRIHWLVVNISDHNARIIFPYDGPHPTRGTGEHHYYFLLLEQKNLLKVSPSTFTNRYVKIKTVLGKLDWSNDIKILDTKFFVSSADDPYL